MNHQYRLSDLHTVVPAAIPAWIRLISCNEINDEDQGIVKEWQDAVFPVLAYATLPDGFGAFLICAHEGPAWCVGNQAKDASIQLSVGKQPLRGTSSLITDGYNYNPSKFEYYYEAITWIIDK